jgi:hypothetical protein
MPRLAWIAWALGIGALLLAVFLPPGGASWLRREIQPLSHALSWGDRVSPYIDLLHVALFAWLAMCAAWLRRFASLLPLTAVLLVLAIGSELAQAFVPGRKPSVDDFLGDVLGIGLGYAVAGIVVLLRRPRG